MDAKYYFSVGGYFASRGFKASAAGSVTPTVPTTFIDFDTDLRVDDAPDLLVAEFRWQYTSNWNLGQQYFNSSRDGYHVLEESIEWEGVTYEIGAEVAARTSVDVTRIVLSRNFRSNDDHDLRLTGGLHWLDLSAEIEGEATLGDGSTAFTASKASASLPIPNLGILYQYSPSEKWLISARVDWFSASIDDWSGSIWNTNVNVNYQVGKNFGLGLGYQFFQIDGRLDEERWKGDLRVRFSGPTFLLSGYW